jgi:hypothetical protein
MTWRTRNGLCCSGLQQSWNPAHRQIQHLTKSKSDATVQLDHHILHILPRVRSLVDLLSYCHHSSFLLPPSFQGIFPSINTCPHILHTKSCPVRKSHLHNVNNRARPCCVYGRGDVAESSKRDAQRKSVALILSNHALVLCEGAWLSGVSSTSEVPGRKCREKIFRGQNKPRSVASLPIRNGLIELGKLVTPHSHARGVRWEE